ncbi:MAG: hypothetical protein ABR606_01415 [Vicinamibacterales bacterium]
MRVRVSSLVLALAVSGALGVAQTPAPSTPPPSAARATPADAPPTPPSHFTYAPEGRRDPFLSLINRGTTEVGRNQVGKRPDGVNGLLVNEVVVRGIVQSREGWVAMVGAPNGKTYTVRPGDKLMDGMVRSITPQLLILMQEINDPLSVDKQREVRKYLRGGEEVQ